MTQLSQDLAAETNGDDHQNENSLRLRKKKTPDKMTAGGFRKAVHHSQNLPLIDAEASILEDDDKLDLKETAVFGCSQEQDAASG